MVDLYNSLDRIVSYTNRESRHNERNLYATSEKIMEEKLGKRAVKNHRCYIRQKNNGLDYSSDKSCDKKNRDVCILHLDRMGNLV